MGCLPDSAADPDLMKRVLTGFMRPSESDCDGAALAVSEWIGFMSQRGEWLSDAHAMIPFCFFLESGSADLAVGLASGMGHGAAVRVSDDSWMSDGVPELDFSENGHGVLAGPAEIAAAFGRGDVLAALSDAGFVLDASRMEALAKMLDSDGENGCHAAWAKAEGEFVMLTTREAGKVFRRPAGI